MYEHASLCEDAHMIVCTHRRQKRTLGARVPDGCDGCQEVNSGLLRGQHVLCPVWPPSAMIKHREPKQLESEGCVSLTHPITAHH